MLNIGGVVSSGALQLLRIEVNSGGCGAADDILDSTPRASAAENKLVKSQPLYLTCRFIRLILTLSCRTR